MRNVMLSLALVAATGCTTSQLNFEHQSKVETRSRGVALIEDSAAAQIGMSGNTCQVDVQSGAIGNDVDVAVGEDDNVVDALGTETLVVGQQGVFVLQEGQWEISGAVVDASDVLDARFTDDGIVSLIDQNGQTVIDWSGTDGQAMGQITLPAGDYSGLTVDRATGTVYVPNQDGVVVATPEGTTQTQNVGDLAAWDATANVLYVAQVGQPDVMAIESNGTVRWTVDMGSPVVSIDDMGEVGAAAVMVGDSESGELVVLNGENGQIMNSLVTPSAADEVIVGNRGRSMAMVLSNEVHFFNVDLTAE